MRFDPSDEKVKKLQQAINVVIITKYKRENAVEAVEPLETTKKEMYDAIKKCQDDLKQKIEAQKEPLQKNETNFDLLMKTMAGGSPKEQEKEQHEAQALILASSWIQAAPQDQLAVVNKIKKMYQDALLAQTKAWYYPIGWYSGDEEVKKRQESFDAKLNALVEDKLQKQATIPVQQVPQQEVPAVGGAGEVKEPEEPVAPGEKQKEEVEQKASEKKEITAEEKRVLVQSYIDTLTSRNLVGSTEEGFRVGDIWLQGLVDIYKNNNIAFNLYVVKELLKAKINTFDLSTEYKVTYITVLDDTIKRLEELVGATIEQKKEPSVEFMQAEKQLAEYIAKLQDTSNWTAGTESKPTHDWLQGLFNIYMNQTVRTNSELLPRILRGGLENLPEAVKITNKEELINQIVKNMEDNWITYYAAQNTEVGGFYYKGL